MYQKNLMFFFDTLKEWNLTPYAMLYGFNLIVTYIREVGEGRDQSRLVKIFPQYFTEEQFDRIYCLKNPIAQFCPELFEEPLGRVKFWAGGRQLFHIYQAWTDCPLLMVRRTVGDDQYPFVPIFQSDLFGKVLHENGETLFGHSWQQQGNQVPIVRVQCRIQVNEPVPGLHLAEGTVLFWCPAPFQSRPCPAPHPVLKIGPFPVRGAQATVVFLKPSGPSLSCLMLTGRPVFFFTFIRLNR